MPTILKFCTLGMAPIGVLLPWGEISWTTSPAEEEFIVASSFPTIMPIVPSGAGFNSSTEPGFSRYFDREITFPEVRTSILGLRLL